MTLTEFVTLVEAEDGMAIKGVNADDEVIVVGPIGTYALPLDTIRDHSWANIGPFLRGERPAAMMKQFTRIVGYYSRIANWNRSKLAELKDRQAGNYALPEHASLQTQHLPEDVATEQLSTNAEGAVCTI